MATKVLAAMSGGVDSSVAAALLKQQGYDIIGATMVLSCFDKSSEKSCCSQKSAEDAKKVADALGFPHYTLNFKDQFKKHVIDNFIGEYKTGRTPNPCVRCNQFIKFDLLMRKAAELGAEYVATGHYAQIKPSPLSPLPEGEGYKLLKGIDSAKDQSYFLYTMNQDILAHTLFPVGSLTKTEVRKIAKDFGLPVHDKKESQEICFIEDDDYTRFLKENVPDSIKPGDIIDKTGKIVGRHDGIAFYTVGQRKGIGAHKGIPKYVISIDPETNMIMIGDQKDIDAKNLTADGVVFVSGKAPSQSMEIKAKIRYNSPEASAVLTKNSKGLFRVEFEKPQRAVTPGQSVVFYNGDEVLGGGLIIKGGD